MGLKQHDIEVSCKTQLCSYITQTVLSETTETLWCCSRRSTYVLQVCHCTNREICLPYMSHKLNQERCIDTCKHIKKMFVIFPEMNYHEDLKTSKLLTQFIRRDLRCKAFSCKTSKPL